MEIILFNTAIGTSNLGDYIIYDSAKTWLNPLLDRSFVMEFGSHLNNLGMLHYLFNSVKVDFAKKCDYKFVMGTNLLTSNMFRSIRQWPVGPISRKIYKNCVMVGVGTTYDNIKMDFFTKQMYKQILNKDIVHSVRDEKSKELLESIGIKAINTGCPTLWGLTKEVCAKIPRDKSNGIIYTLSGYGSQKNEEKDQILVDIIEKNYEDIYFFVQTTEDEKYYKSLRHNKEAKMIYSLEGFRKVCRENEVDYIGTRLHGGVFAMQNYVRSIIVEIDHRAAGFREANNIVTISRDNIENLDQMINSSFETNIKIREKEIAEWKSQFPFL